MTRAKQHFNQGGAQYAQFRPDYPPELAHQLSALCYQHQLALDVGCGNGQLTRLLADHFSAVVGTDSSEDQVAHARGCQKVTYRCEPAETISLADNSADLIVVAQAAHWFDLDAFYAQVKRVLKLNGVIALISYGVPYLEDTANSVFQQGYWQQLHHFWPPERRHVENGYLDLEFPFLSIPLKPLFIRRAVNYDQLCGYIRTWSAYSQAEKSQQSHQFDLFFERLKQAWQEDLSNSKSIVWPLSVKAGKVPEHSTKN